MNRHQLNWKVKKSCILGIKVCLVRKLNSIFLNFQITLTPTLTLHYKSSCIKLYFWKYTRITTQTRPDPILLIIPAFFLNLYFNDLSFQLLTLKIGAKKRKIWIRWNDYLSITDKNHSNIFMIDIVRCQTDDNCVNLASMSKSNEQFTKMALAFKWGFCRICWIKV